MVEGEGEHVDLVVEAEQLQELEGLEGAAAGEGDHDQLVGQVDVLFCWGQSKKGTVRSGCGSRHTATENGCRLFTHDKSQFHT